MKIPAPAKINLSLDIIGKRADGYHFLDMVMQSVSLYDTVSMEVIESAGIHVLCSEGDVPCGKENTVYRAADAFFSVTGVSPKSGLLFSIQKNIPRQAGLGGGSADAAAALRLLNSLYGTKLSREQMKGIALSAGADVPFCVEGGTARVTGIGEVVTQLAPMPTCSIVICQPDVGISTKEAYEFYDRNSCTASSHTSAVLSALKSKQLGELGCALGNAFETAGVPPQISEIKEEMIHCGCEGSCMSGSGSAVFGLFGDSEKAERCRGCLLKRYSAAFLCRPVAEYPV